MRPTRAATLSTLLEDLPYVAEVPDLETTGIAYRSDRVDPGDVFFCIRGFVHDGHDFVREAVSRGAAAVVVERSIKDVDAVQVVVEDTRIALAHASAVAFGRPSERMEVVGITGTNGKTTTTYLVESVLRAAGRRCGLIGTVERRLGEERMAAEHTTPESVDLQALLAGMADRGADSAAMEVSSHAIDLHRVDALRFAVAAFTNLTQDHLDYHRTLEEYFAVKRRLFTDFEVGAKVVYIDDGYGALLAEEVRPEWTAGFSRSAAVRACDLEMSSAGSRFRLVTPMGETWVSVPLAGEYNVSNSLVAAACGLALGIGLDAVAEGLRLAPQVPGRLERVDAGQGFAVLVDYAHTPDALDKALRAVRAITPGRLTVVFGCGGDRDPEKRVLMGAAAGRLADHTFITTDNPRSEDPVGIILQIEDGLKAEGGSYEVEVDRRRAIAKALRSAAAGDSVLIAGKGHEDHQIFADRTIRFDDREVAREELEVSWST